jgi:Ca2+-binding EF-hand superfamily protein
VGFTAFATLSGYVVYKSVILNKQLPSQNVVLAKGNAADVNNPAKQTIQSQRELRFLSFASVEYEGNIYMTPQDFLESVAEEMPRPRTSRRHLRQNEVEKFLKNTPSRGKGSNSLFRSLFDKGIISYTEYLFLLCVLTKPKSGFQIAFNMFDTDGDQRVDKKEFLVLDHLMASGSSQGASVKEEESAENPLCSTTLTTHFFGFNGKDVLKYEDFHRFMDNIQTEVLELEFNEFSHGMPTITEEEFARVLLRYTVLTKQRHEEYLERLRKRIPHVQGITFKDFKDFIQFLNNLDDFNLAMRIYTYTNHPISEVDFQRAVKACIGQNLNSHLIHVVFQLFDEDGDGRLSHQEFISVMKERLHRGARILGQNRWDSYKSCVRNEMRTS